MGENQIDDARKQEIVEKYRRLTQASHDSGKAVEQICEEYSVSRADLDQMVREVEQRGAGASASAPSQPVQQPGHPGHQGEGHGQGEGGGREQAPGQNKPRAGQHARRDESDDDE